MQRLVIWCQVLLGGRCMHEEHVDEGIGGETKTGDDEGNGGP